MNFGFHKCNFVKVEIHCVDIHKLGVSCILLPLWLLPLWLLPPSWVDQTKLLLSLPNWNARGPWSLCFGAGGNGGGFQMTYSTTVLLFWLYRYVNKGNTILVANWNLLIQPHCVNTKCCLWGKVFVDTAWGIGSLQYTDSIVHLYVSLIHGLPVIDDLSIMILS